MQLPGLHSTWLLSLAVRRKLSFSLSSLSSSGGAGNFALTSPTLKPGQSSQLPLILMVPRGQPSLSGSFTSKVGFALAGAGGAGRATAYRSGGYPLGMHRATHI